MTAIKLLALIPKLLEYRDRIEKIETDVAGNYVSIAVYLKDDEGVIYATLKEDSPLFTIVKNVKDLL